MQLSTLERNHSLFSARLGERLERINEYSRSGEGLCPPVPRSNCVTHNSSYIT